MFQLSEFLKNQASAHQILVLSYCHELDFNIPANLPRFYVVQLIGFLFLETPLITSMKFTAM